MNGARARRIRRAVYGDYEQRERSYGAVPHDTLCSHCDYHYSRVNTGRRAVYKRLKRSYLLALRKGNA